MKVHVLVTMAFPPELLERIRTASPEVELTYLPLKAGEQVPKEAAARAAVLYTWTAVPKPEDAPELRWIQFHSAGVDQIRGHPILDSDVAITTNSGINAVPVAEYVMTMILAWAHRLPRMLTYQKRGIWPGGRWTKFVPQELRGSTIGILGYGSIGREVARQARAFGMKVLATKRDPRQMEENGFALDGTGDPGGNLPHRVYPAAATRSMLPECDFVVICAPLTQETRHMVGEEVLKAMKETAFLVNVSRGKLVNEGALVTALIKGWIAGAALDVFEVEPLPADSMLWKLDNVILSPHVAGFTPEYDRRAIEVFSRNLRRFVEGQPLINLVDQSTGY